MRPPRPSRRDTKGDWQRWAYDELIALRPSAGAGVLTNVLSETHRRLLKQHARTLKDKPTECSLPVLGNQYYHFGLWYDLAGELHLWNTSLISHSGQTWARFTNPYCGGLNQEGGQAPYCGYVATNPDTHLSASSACLLPSDIVISPGPTVFGGTKPPHGNALVLDLNQWVDLLVYPAKRNSGYFYLTFPNLPADRDIVFASGVGYYVFNRTLTDIFNGTGTIQPLSPPFTLPY